MLKHQITSSVKCVIAILLTTPPYIEPVDRMVLVSENLGHQGFYGIYQKKDFPYNTASTDFPALVPNSDIHVRKSSIGQLTTYAAYCSTRFSEHDIIQKITKEWKQITEEKYFNLNLDKDMETACYEIIRNTEPNHLKISNLKSHSECSDGVLVSLILSNSIKVVGPYSSFAPVIPTGDLTILADVGLSINQIILWGEAYRLSRVLRSKIKILVWYHGQLHIFEEITGQQNRWVPITKVGKEEENGKEIYEYFSQRIMGLTEFQKEVSKASKLGSKTRLTVVKDNKFPSLFYEDPTGNIAYTSIIGSKV
ncbi:putative effector protein [Blumeria hordei DH14]|uniref:Putative effector protein n=1 Tax=Blumeria graminis f. sp. hordei (strain DH14) TaxID=546991 RepID=N1JCC9_BLUG1|nr:putative effector protein [Blumeria hordei DH14]